MSKFILLFALSLFPILSYGQVPNPYQHINELRHQQEFRGMISLTSWASLNIAGGSAGYFMSNQPEWKYFHEMNVFWNTVNLGLGIYGLCSLKKPDQIWDFDKSMKAQKKLERIFLVNSCIDVLYIGGGAVMLHMANNREAAHRLSGYGRSLILQGSYLFLFDVAEYFLQRKNRLDLQKKKGHLSINSQGLGLSLCYQFN